MAFSGIVFFMGGKTEVSEIRKKYVKKKKEKESSHRQFHDRGREDDRINQSLRYV